MDILDKLSLEEANLVNLTQEATDDEAYGVREAYLDSLFAVRSEMENIKALRFEAMVARLLGRRERRNPYA